MNVFDYYSHQELEQKLIDRTVKTDYCWNFIGKSHNKGYVQMEFWKAGRKMLAVHRLSYMLYKGDIPEGYTIDHLCENKACVNPGHLDAVTIRENAQRWHKNHPTTHCPQGHEYNEENTRREDKGEGRFVRRICRPCARIRANARYLKKQGGQLKKRGRKPKKITTQENLFCKHGYALANRMCKLGCR